MLREGGRKKKRKPETKERKRNKKGRRKSAGEEAREDRKHGGRSPADARTLSQIIFLSSLPLYQHGPFAAPFAAAQKSFAPASRRRAILRWLLRESSSPPAPHSRFLSTSAVVPLPRKQNKRVHISVQAFTRAYTYRHARTFTNMPTL